MSGYNYESDRDDFEEVERGNNGGGLRKLLEDTLAENKKLREAIEGRDREKSTSALLKDKGLDPAIAELIPADQDPAQWVEKYAHLLGVKDNTQAFEDKREQPNPELPDDGDPALALERAALADMEEAAAAGTSALSADVLERMNKITSEDELLKFFQSNGATGG